MNNAWRPFLFLLEVHTLEKSFVGVNEVGSRLASSKANAPILVPIPMKRKVTPYIEL